MLNSKWKNVGLWISIFALIPLLCQGFGLNILPSNYEQITSTILGILVSAGILSNPSVGSGYTDKVSTTEETNTTENQQ